MKRLHEYQIHELYNRMVRLWGNLEINDFYNILDQEGYYDLKTRIEITEKMYEDLKRSYGLSWRKVLGSMLNGTDPNLNKRTLLPVRNESFDTFPSFKKKLSFE